jgi:hypothetical protein
MQNFNIFELSYYPASCMALGSYGERPLFRPGKKLGFATIKLCISMFSSAKNSASGLYGLALEHGAGFAVNLRGRISA